MPFFEFKSYQIYYFDSDPSSSKPVITFIHGWTASSKSWTAQIEYFSPNYRVIAIDLLGHGQSSQPSPSEANELYTHIGFQDSVITLLNHLSIPKTNLVGWSMGMQEALGIVHRFPERIQSLILIGTSPLFSLPTDEITFPALPRSAMDGLLAGLSTSFDQIIDGVVFGFYPEYTPGEEPVPKYIQQQLEDTKHVGGTLAVAIQNNVGSVDHRPLVPEIKTRTLIIHGEKDHLTPPAAGEWVFNNLGSKDKKFLVYEEPGHAVMVGPTTQRFNKDVEEFLQQSQH